MVMKILCIGNNTEDTDRRAGHVAEENLLVNHGLLSDLDGTVCLDSRTQAPGVYHTSFVDLCFDRVKQAVSYFDRIMILDQPIHQWNTTTEFYDTINYAVRLGEKVEWQNGSSCQNLLYWRNQINNNASFCIWPFIQMSLYDSYATLCCISDKKLKNTREISDFNNQTYSDIRRKMLAGERIDHCVACYDIEARGISSPRQQHTLEWSTRLALSDTDDLAKITSPISLEIHLDNMCNLQCRMCGPAASSLIEKEYRQLGIIQQYPEFVSGDNKRALDDFLAVEGLQKIYFTGGEPTANARVYDFLEHCIANDKTDFVLQINTNAWKISDKFVNLTKQFRRVEFIVSLDAFDRANDYIRWPSHWDHIQNNITKLIDVGVVSFAVSLSLYGIFSFADLMRFLDQTYPGHYVHCQFVENQSPLMIGYDRQHIDKIDGIRHLPIYLNNPAVQSFVDGLSTAMQCSTLQQESLRKFFSFNDQLDASRDSRLADYIPELEQIRSLV